MRTILIVAEEPYTQRFIQVNLQRVGYGVLQAFTGEDALRQIKTERPHLVVLDMTLPDMDGWGFLARLKENEYSRTLPIIALTLLPLAHQDYMFWVNEWTASGAWLSKPIDPLNLLSLAKRLLAARYDEFQYTGGPISFGYDK